MKDERKQVAEQCEAVVHMASAIAEVHREKGKALGAGLDIPLDIVGPSTATLMETLGNILNGMDAVTDEDKWLEPIFAEAQRRYPSK